MLLQCGCQTRYISNKVASNLPSAREVANDLSQLFARDWANFVRQMLYTVPEEQWANPFRIVRKARAYFHDLQKVNKRKLAGDGREVARTNLNSSLPDYYLQNFHYQSDGYLSEASAELYDYQVEVVFNGGAEAMRRQALVPLGKAFGNRNIRDLRLLDLAWELGNL